MEINKSAEMTTILGNLVIVMVLYKSGLDQSETVASLLKDSNHKFDILLYDNSPLEQYAEKNFEYHNLNITYVHDETNPGLAGAYNYALKYASEENYNWLMLLDQDTVLSNEYLNSLKDLNMDSLPDEIAAIIPKVVSLTGDKVISPLKMKLGGFVKPVNLSSGVVDEPVTGINSGTILNVDYLKSIGGFGTEYTLDMLDHWYFRKIYNDGFKCFLLSATINQNLSVHGVYEENVSPGRYEQMLSAESKFISGQGLLGVGMFKIRLLFRILKQLRFKNKKYLALTLRYLGKF